MKKENVVTVTNNDDVTVSNSETKEPEKKLKTIKITFDRQLNLNKAYIKLSLEDPTLKQYADDYGYHPERVQGLYTLLSDVNKLYNGQMIAQGVLVEVQRLFREKFKIADGTIRDHVAVARMAFRKDPATYALLHLGERRKKTYGSWMEQNNNFYTTLLSLTDAVAQMTKYHVAQAELEAGQKELQEVSDAFEKKLNAKAEAQKATELKTKAWQKFKKAMSKFHNVMRVVLEEDPQMKEKLGMVTPIDV